MLDTDELIRKLRGLPAALALGAGAALALVAATPEARQAEPAGAPAAAATRAAEPAPERGPQGAGTRDGGSDRAESPAEAREPLLESYLAERADPAELFGGIPDRIRRQRLWDDLKTFYERRAYVPAWTRDGRLQRPARELVGALAGAPDRGLDPADYRTAELTAAVEAAGRSRLEPERAARLDAVLTAAFLAHAADLCCGRIDAGRAGPLWKIEPEPVDLAAALAGALEERRIESVLDRLTAPHPEARRLAEALARYREIAANGGWPRVPDGPLLEPGDEAEPARLAALADRLRAEGDLSERAAAALRSRWRRALKTAGEAEAGDGGGTRKGRRDTEAPATGEPDRRGDADRHVKPATLHYDRLLVAALRRFQARNGLKVDGKLGEDTMAALAVTAAERAARLALNLERWRWLPDDLGERHVRVNIADYRLTAYDRGREALTMPVVVGRRSWPTPIFADRMTRVEMNPYWYVPRSIARADIAPKARKDPDYLSRQGYQLVDRDTGERVDPSSVSPAALGTEVRVRQRPGRANALGRIKFLFPNEFNVYLHDTPADSLFERTDRAFSHGCVRVAEPLELADFVFAEEPEWTPERVREEIATGRTERVELERAIPVYILYSTAFVDDDGRVHFRPDVYDHDERLASVLAAARGDRLAALIAPDARPPEDGGGLTARRLAVPRVGSQTSSRTTRGQGPGPSPAEADQRDVSPVSTPSAKITEPGVVSAHETVSMTN